MKWTSIWLREQATARAAEGLSALAYKGVDVVSSVVIMNRVEFAAETTWSFEVRDLETEAIPNGYDLILCRDALQHLPIVSALKSM
ncbi:hypothetical protein SARC_04889 [Sphaeroforma arctica JP610]|uniref:Class I SAM-dependent methyltransferase n=1 Tax=Sphaeroforma arctica JP610 TaxID=667725 RepID=A0A0L0G133_9EUKA|nr:hypothetical protein SARC_04889 [Sphaeroforma arctica JP610]KNC82842.1 hypothetical protein SARC_04889 [Sphaeroforma arctica JP610]|eukprot:XP_014156744.1 hypothetical protein SARC_04889 [Sphaeroforma arctica JP610]